MDLHQTDAMPRRGLLAELRRVRDRRRLRHVMARAEAQRRLQPARSSSAGSAAVVAGLVALSWLGVWALYRLAAWGLS